MDKIASKIQFTEINTRWNKKIYLNKPIVIKEIISNLSKKQTAGPGFTGKFYHSFKEEITIILYKFFQEKEKTHPKPFHEDSVILISKSETDISNRENGRTISIMNTAAKILNKTNTTICQKDTHIL